MPQRVVSHCTAIDFVPCRVSPRVVVTVRQMTRPKSRFAEIGERRILLLCGRPPATCRWFKQQTRAELNYPAGLRRPSPWMRRTPEVTLAGARSPHVTVLSGRPEERDPSGARILIGTPTIARMMSASAILRVCDPLCTSPNDQCFMTDERNRSTAQRREAQDERSFTFVASFSRSGGQCAQKKGYRRTNL